MATTQPRNPGRRGCSRPPRVVALALCLVGLLATTSAAPAAAGPAAGGGNPVLDWNLIAQDAIAVGRRVAGHVTRHHFQPSVTGPVAGGAARSGARRGPARP
jgi:hypothetical protein